MMRGCGPLWGYVGVCVRACVYACVRACAPSWPPPAPPPPPLPVAFYHHPSSIFAALPLWVLRELGCHTGEAANDSRVQVGIAVQLGLGL